MKRLAIPVLLLVLAGFGCSEPGATTARTVPTRAEPAVDAARANPYVPPTGADVSSGVETPGRRRLMTATSSDGLTFTRTNEIVTDQANVPDMVMEDDGTIYLYFSGWEVGDRQNAMGVAVSEDQGESWAFHQVTISGGPDMTHSGDPDVVLLDDGTFRLYSTFALPKTTTQAIFYSESSDGVAFDYGGVAFQSSPAALDSSTHLVGDAWHMYTLVGETLDSYHATSNDGLSFERLSREAFRVRGKEVVMSNALPFDGGWRMYGFSPRDGDIRSLWSEDGTSWAEEDGTRLALDPSSELESEYVKDPAVIRLADGTYLMVYATQIP